MCGLHEDTRMAESNRQEALDDVALLALELGYDIDVIDPERAERARELRRRHGGDDLERLVWQKLAMKWTYRSPECAAPWVEPEGPAPGYVALTKAKGKRLERELEESGIDEREAALRLLHERHITPEEAMERMGLAEAGGG